MKAWKDGELVPCTSAEFTAGLRRHGAWANEALCIRSDPAANLGDLLIAAAEEIDKSATLEATIKIEQCSNHKWIKQGSGSFGHGIRYICDHCGAKKTIVPSINLRGSAR